MRGPCRIPFRRCACTIRLTRRAEPLEPHRAGPVTIYTCGSTVYKYAHIGNLRTYLFGDLLHRTLEYLGYEVRYVKNITDVGHMRNDDHDSLAGADKMELAAETEGKSPDRDRRLLHRCLARGRSFPEHPAGRRDAEGQRPHRRDDLAH